MSESRTISSKNLVRQEAIQFIRPQNLKLELIESRPYTKMYVFFDGINVTNLCSPSGQILGSEIISNSIGQVSITFSIPPQKFNTGNHEIIVTDTNNLVLLTTSGSVYGSAKANFSANGTLSIFQTINTTITAVERVVPIITTDPLAQSFFTTGVKGGMFLTSINVYFQTKDDSLPVRCEIRPMVNGYPSSIDAPSPSLVSIIDPNSIRTSLDASIATKFPFNPPLYLKEDQDYCFILRSNSNNYNVYTSRMGESSIEDGLKIFSQPYVGSLFKSENSKTWTAEQFEDIKFVINKAKFDTSGGTAQFIAQVPALGAYGTQFFTESGSNIVTYKHTQEHGLESGSIIHFTSIHSSNSALYSTAMYNGIPWTEFSGNKTVLSVIDRNTITFQTTTLATTTGDVSSGNILTNLIVINGGINYQPNDTITFNGGGGTGATGSLVIENGNVKSVVITTVGSGYSTQPNYTINSTTGTGCNLLPVVLPSFTVLVNKPMNGFIPKINVFNYGESKTKSTISTTIGNYSGGNLNSYSSGKTIPFEPNKPYPNINQNSLIASPLNEVTIMGGVSSAKVSINLSTSNPNVSPVIDLNNIPTLTAYSTIINNQPGETITAINSSGSISSIITTSVGSGYTADPTVVISAPDFVDGIQATATVNRTGSSINTFTITNPGSGYTSIPIITIVKNISDSTGTGSSGQAQLIPYNTELLSTGGQAKARYITKRTTIQIVSTGIRLYSVISSMQGSSVDWYIRTSLSGSGITHDTQNWVRLNCDILRNKSSTIDEMFEYEFYLDNLTEFDNYDLKCVMTATDPSKAPIINSYRVIVVV